MWCERTCADAPNSACRARSPGDKQPCSSPRSSLADLTFPAHSAECSVGLPTTWASGSMIERMSEDDWQLWRDVRLEGLRLHPEAFGSSFEEEKDLSEDYWRRRLRQITALAYGANDAIAGIAVLAQEAAIKRRHRANLFSMYVRSGAWGRGIGSALVKAVLDQARGTVLQVHCSVITSNDRARQLYERHGFQVYGTEPRALRAGDHFYDEYLMCCRLD
jgi:ribosomal protein S18 acetylase RimI-like enzyme